MHKWDFRNTYYLIVYLVREWKMWGVWELKTPVGVRRGGILLVSQKSATTYRCLHLIFFFFCWSRDWLRFARPSLFGTPLQEISNHLPVFASDFRFLSAGKRASRSYKTKIRKQFSLFPDFLRRERDKILFSLLFQERKRTEF